MTKYINWYIYFSYNYLCLGRFVSSKLPYLGIEYPLIGRLLIYHNFISFSLFIIGFLSFVLSLKQGFLKYQFRLFGWIIIATLLIATPAWSMCSNTYEGLIFFVLPSMLIVINDIFAYIFGYFFGKHQLIALSPKKTWEGYIGGAVSTCLFSIVVRLLPFSWPLLYRAFQESLVQALSWTLSPLPCPTARLQFSTRLALGRLVSLSFRPTSCCFRSSQASLVLSVVSSLQAWRDRSRSKYICNNLGLRKRNSGPWRCEWQNGLPVNHGQFCLFLPSDLHKGVDCRHIRLHSFFTDPWRTTAPLQHSSDKPRPDESHLVLIHFLIKSLINFIISIFYIP